jgi:PAS domain S-box-containing protein
MDRLRAILRELEQAEHDLLQLRKHEQESTVRLFWWGIAAPLGALVLTLAVLYYLIRRRQAQAQVLHLSEERFRLFAERVVDYAIIMLDSKGQITSWSAGAQRIKGYDYAEVIGRHFALFYPPEDVRSAKAERELEEAAAKGSVEDQGWRIRKDGSRFWAHVVITAIHDEAGVLCGFGEVTQDLTDRKQAEEELHNEVGERRRIEAQLKELNQTLEQRVAERTSDLVALNQALGSETEERKRAQSETVDAKQRLTGIIDSAMDAIITIDEKQRIVLFNAAAEVLFGCPQAQALGAPLVWFIPKRFRESHTAHVERFGRTGVSSRRMGAQRIVMGLRQNGREFPIEASISQIEQNGEKFYTVILRDVTERVMAEESLRESQQELHELASSAQAAREQEKSRIARELHDELGQLLTSLKMDLESLKATIAREDHMALAEGMETLLNTTVAATRRIASDLRPLMLDDLGLVPAAEWLVQNFRQRTGIECGLTVVPTDLDLQDPHATAIYRILQESLTNVAKHAHAAFVEVTIEQSSSDLLLTIRDNGRGFHPKDPRKPNSFGLVGLRERVFFLGGSVVIESEPGNGTTIRARIPFAPGSAVPIGQN